MYYIIILLLLLILHHILQLYVYFKYIRIRVHLESDVFVFKYIF